MRVRGATTRDNEASLASMRGAGFVVRDLPEDPSDPEREVQSCVQGDRVAHRAARAGRRASRPSAMSRVRLVATDLDGTLVHSDGSITPRTRDALLAAEAAGISVVFVTGRPLRWAEEVFDHVGGHGLAIVSNGALVWDVAGNDVRTTRTIDPVVGLEVCALIRAAVPGTHFAVRAARRHRSRARLPRAQRDPRRRAARGGRGDLRRPGAEAARAARGVPAQVFWDRAEAVVGDRVVVTWSSASAMLEMSAAGVTKATTLALLCAERGISPDEVLALGDMPNDIALLEWAGTSYAMGNAHHTVQAVADHVAPTNDEDGVARVIEGLLSRG